MQRLGTWELGKSSFSLALGTDMDGSFQIWATILEVRVLNLELRIVFWGLC